MVKPQHRGGRRRKRRDCALGDGWVYGYEAETGKILWKFDANFKEAVYPKTRNELIATPIVFEGRLYIASGQDPEHSEGCGVLWCVDIKKRGDISDELDAPAAMRRATGRNAVGGQRQGVPNPNSGVVWKFTAIDKQGAQANNRDLPAAKRMNRTMATVAIDPLTGLMFLPDYSGFLHCLDARTGRHFWTHDLDGDTWGSSMVCDGKVYQGSEDGFVRIFEAGKVEKMISEHDLGGAIYSTPIFANDTLYLMTCEKLFAIRAAPIAGPASHPTTAVK